MENNMTSRGYSWILFRLVSVLALLTKVESLCFFPNEYLGTYLIQTQTEGFGSPTTSFSEITFENDAIPPWGKCFRKRGNNVILKDSTGGEDCMRCFHITLKAPNVIQIHTEGLGKCYTKEEAVKATCPDERSVYERKFKEIMLYRKQDVIGPTAPEQIFCPISGKFRFTYTANNGNFRCDQTMSELSNCPHGNVLGVKFRQCTFPNIDVNFRCLGDWEGPNNDRYLALMELKNSSEERFKFRCGMYRIDPLTGRVFVSLSADSTCYNLLRSPTDGYESLILTPFPEKSPPGPVLHAHCRFPDWIQGEWDGVQIVRNVLIYKDNHKLQRFSLTCLRKEEDTEEDRFIVFSSTHCGEESYNCVWLKKRSENVMEFQIGSRPSHSYTDTLCHDLQFNEDSWVTQGRLKPTQMFPCPITGDYTGMLPENPGLCAKVASDCNNPDVMFYTVTSCENKSLIFEEREYRCLGSWRDPSGVTFTYTQRREMEGFQCFSGKVLQSGKEAYIKEAGLSCIRSEDPIIFGMKITKHSSCPDVGLSVSHGPRYPTNIPNDIDDPFYNPVPNDPNWYQKESDNSDEKARKSPTRSTKEEEEEDRFNAAMTLSYQTSWIFACAFCSYCMYWIHRSSHLL